MVETKLAQKHCAPCQGGTPPLQGAELDRFYDQLEGDWRMVARHHLDREFHLHDFREALDFTNALGEIAEREGHHPDILLSWGKVRVTIFTHKIDGLTESDFVLAAKYDELWRTAWSASAKPR